MTFCKYLIGHSATLKAPLPTPTGAPLAGAEGFIVALSLPRAKQPSKTFVLTLADPQRQLPRVG